jgi:hypothetical protein
MKKCINFREFLYPLLEDQKLITQGAEIMKAIVEAQSPRLTHIAAKMADSAERGYKTAQRFVKQVDLPQGLLYSGLFVLLKQKPQLDYEQVAGISHAAACAFSLMVHGFVRSFVRT